MENILHQIIEGQTHHLRQGIARFISCPGCESGSKIDAHGKNESSQYEYCHGNRCWAELKDYVVCEGKLKLEPIYAYSTHHVQVHM